MPVNPYLQRDKTKYREVNTYEDIVIEAIQFAGNEVHYIPRKLNKFDRIYGEDVLSSFDVAIPVEMYLESVDGFDGESEMISRFGLEIRDNATFILSRRRWQQSLERYVAKAKVNDKLAVRPQEGDLIFFPLANNALFEITFVEDREPFFQLEKIVTWKIRASLFQYNNEEFDTGIAEIDNINTFSENRLNHAMLMENQSVELNPEPIRILTQSGGYILLETYDFESFADNDPQTEYGDNEEYKNEFLDVIDFTENNPFSEDF